MRIAILLFSLFVLFSFETKAQGQTRVPPTPPPNPNIAREREGEWQEIRGRLDRLVLLPRRVYREKTMPRVAADPSVLKIYRESTKEERTLLAPEIEDANKHREFLKQPKSGMMKLVIDLGCDELSNKNPGGKICDSFSMPGGGSAYSFRRNDYQFWRLADLLYDGKSFLAFGQMSQGFLLNIGDVPLNDLTRNTKGLDFVFAFAPENTVAGSERQHKQFVEGLLVDGFLYKKFLPAVENNTYILRSVAFKGVAAREERGFRFNELEFDKREDLIVAFRVVRKDFNATATLLWKILQSKPSPVLNFPDITSEPEK